MKKSTLFISVLMLAAFFLLEGCKESLNDSTNPAEVIMDEPSAPDEAFLSKYRGCYWKTRFELLKVMIATAKYLNFRKALEDGYADINVIMPNMGYHYMKAEYNDGKFELTKPEILVYSKTANGKMRLVAVEYAVPIDLSPDSPPQGFTGDADVWNYNTDFGLWLLHAWVWKYNPEGVFNPTNPTVP